MRNIILLGASGSIGTSTIEVLLKYKNDFNLIGIAVNKSYDRVNEIINYFPSIKCVYISDEYKSKVNFNNVTSNIEELLDIDKNALVINGISGIDGLKPTLIAIKNNQDIGLANKESIVCGGEIINKLLESSNSKIIPLDSEHSALYQCLIGENKKDVNNLILTCSGGPFEGYTLDIISKVYLDDCLKHPTWNMGKKITIDCASLFNKGLEVIEAHYLFNIPYEQIKVIIHKESVIHSLVEYKDGCIKALISKPSMQLPILFALNNKNRDKSIDQDIDLAKISKLTFKEVDNNIFRSIDLAYTTGKKAGYYPMIYCVANEIAVNEFINNNIKFLDIYKVVEHMVNSLELKNNMNEENLYYNIKITKEKTMDYIKEMKGE